MVYLPWPGSFAGCARCSSASFVARAMMHGSSHRMRSRARCLARRLRRRSRRSPRPHSFVGNAGARAWSQSSRGSSRLPVPRSGFGGAGQRVPPDRRAAQVCWRHGHLRVLLPNLPREVRRTATHEPGFGAGILCERPPRRTHGIGLRRPARWFSCGRGTGGRLLRGRRLRLFGLGGGIALLPRNQQAGDA